MKALLLATTAPDGTSHRQTGSTNWTLRLCKTLHNNHTISLVTPPPLSDPWLRNSGIEIIEHPTPQTGNRLGRILSSCRYGVYPSVWSLHSPETSQHLRNLTANAFDVCWLLDDYAGIYLRDIPQHLPTVFVRHYLFSMQDSFHQPGAGLKARIRGHFHRYTARAFDQWTTRRADIVTFGTQESCNFLRNTCPDNRVEHLPTKPCKLPQPTEASSLDVPRGPDERLLAVFLADMRFVRNADGARWFLEQVLPAMPEALRRQYHFQFIGRKPEPAPELDRLPGGSSVEMTGFVDDLTASLHRAQLAFIPVFGGNGVRLKTLTLLGTGLPTVSTPDALEGLTLDSGETVLEATTAETFVQAFERLRDPGVRRTLSGNCLRAMKLFLGEEQDAERALELSRSVARRP